MSEQVCSPVTISKTYD